MLHCSEKVICQKLRNRRLIPRRYLNANILKFANAKDAEKSSFSSPNKLQSTYIYILFPLIKNFNFWYSDVLRVSFVVFPTYTADDMTI